MQLIMRKEMQELRRELEQLRGEIRRSPVSKEEANNKIITEWLVEAVKELQSEMREIATKIQAEKEPDIQTDFNILNAEIEDVRHTVTDLRNEEKKKIVLFEEANKHFHQLHNPENLFVRHSKINIDHHEPYHKLSKKHL